MTFAKLDATSYRKCLDQWVTESRRKLSLRYPEIDFDSNHWLIKGKHGTCLREIYLTTALADFSNKDINFTEVLRCLIVEILLDGKRKCMYAATRPYRLFAQIPTKSIFNLSLLDLQAIESARLEAAIHTPSSASPAIGLLSEVAKIAAILAKKGVVARHGFQIRSETMSKLRNITKSYSKTRKEKAGDSLDRKMEAFNEAINALVNGDPRLSPLDRVAIATAIRLLCAPSRINEVLCSSIDDHMTIQDYGHSSIGTEDAVHRAHQMLLVTMKGSKGAEWSAKPVLSFMIDAFNFATDLIINHGERSRMLVRWYLSNPSTLYLPKQLEYLRNKNISRTMLAKIIHLTETPPKAAVTSSVGDIFKILSRKIFKGQGPDKFCDKKGRNTRPTIDFLSWADLEEHLLARVHKAMIKCREVTRFNQYEGDLSKMLMLFDHDVMPCLPYAVNYRLIKRRFKQYNEKKSMPSTVFKKLGIAIPIDGKVQIAEMDSHDPRRWLTTTALKYGEGLSDVLINKWANRCSLSQLKYYDFRTSEDLASFSKMPATEKLTELSDISRGLCSLEKLENVYGLKTNVVTAHDAGIAMTSIDMILEAAENRPVASSSRGLIIMYPQKFGVCFHQHHETPCRNYSNSLVGSCITCSEGAHIKGHIPTNDRTRELDSKVFDSIVRHLKGLALAHNREIADDQVAFGEHILTLVKKGIDTKSLENVAAHLIEEFDEIKDQIKDKLFLTRLEEAYVTSKVVNMLDDPNVPSGALIKYHNPKAHANPLSEVALDSHGGREQVDFDEKILVEQFPEFAHSSTDLNDSRHLIEPEVDEGENREW